MKSTTKIRSISEWLEILPEPARTEALENYKNSTREKKGALRMGSLQMALNAAFTWMHTTQGQDYWYDIYNRCDQIEEKAKEQINKTYL